MVFFSILLKSYVTIVLKIPTVLKITALSYDFRNNIVAAIHKKSDKSRKLHSKVSSRYGKGFWFWVIHVFPLLRHKLLSHFSLSVPQEEYYFFEVAHRSSLTNIIPRYNPLNDITRAAPYNNARKTKFASSLYFRF